DILPEVELDILYDIDTCVSSNATISVPVTGLYFDSIFVNNTFSANNTVLVSSDTLLNIIGTNSCSQDNFQVQVNFNYFPEYSFTPTIDTCLANGLEVILNVDSGNDNLEWWNGNIASNQSVFGSGVYYFEVSNNCGTINDSIIVNYSSAPIFNVSDSVTACIDVGESVVVHGSSSDESVIWMPGGERDSIMINESGVYHYQITNACGIFNDSLIAVIDYNPSYTIEDTFFICGNQFDFNSYGFEATHDFNVFDENGNELNSSISESGDYYFYMSSYCGVVNHKFNVQLNDDVL